MKRIAEILVIVYFIAIGLALLGALYVMFVDFYKGLVLTIVLVVLTELSMIAHSWFVRKVARKVVQKWTRPT